jgi:metal-sulfur cluster biosynthetic enzyme
MAVTEELVLEELKKVIDPELFVNIVDLGLIYKVDFTDATAESTESGESTESTKTESTETESTETESTETESTETGVPADPAQTETIESAEATPESDSATVNVKIDMTMTSPMCPAGPQLVGQSKAVVGLLAGVGEVEVKVVLDPPWTPDRMTDDARDKLGIF